MNWREIWFIARPTVDRELAQLKGDILKIWQLRAKNNWRNFQVELSRTWQDIIALPGIIKRRIWNKHLLLAWHRLWLRRDEFHPSLDLDDEAMMEMNPSERESYRQDLQRRRQQADSNPPNHTS